MSTKIIQLAVTLFMLFLLAGCEQFSTSSAKESAGIPKARAERPDHAVEIVLVETRAVRLKRSLTGTLEAPRTVHVHSEQAGRVIDLAFYEGDSVKQGVVLAKLDDALLRAGLAKVVAARKQTEVDLKRLQNLVPLKLATEDELARAGTSVELAQAEESLQRTLLSRTVSKAPFSGVISARLKEPGDIVALNEHMLTLFDPGYMTAAVQLPEQLHSRVALGDAVKLRIDSLGDRRFSASILRIHPVLDAQTRQGTVEILLDPVPTGARPGQLCRVTLETAETPRRLIPLNALQFDSQGSFVYRLDEDSKAQRSAVTTGLQIDDFIEIIEGVSDGDSIVAKGFLGLKSGQSVRVVQSGDKRSAETGANKPVQE